MFLLRAEIKLPSAVSAAIASSKPIKQHKIFSQSSVSMVPVKIINGNKNNVMPPNKTIAAVAFASTGNLSLSGWVSKNSAVPERYSSDHKRMVTAGNRATKIIGWA